MFCLTCGKKLSDNTKFCTNCGTNLVETLNENTTNSLNSMQISEISKKINTEEILNTIIQPINNSGQGTKTIVPNEIKGWNWGAFLFSWIWAIVNKTYRGLFCLIPIFGIYYCFVLGRKGNEWSWQNNQWNSIQEFKKVQSTWSKAAIPFTTICIFLGIISIIIQGFSQ